MNNLIPFIIKSSISLMVLYTYYYLVLKRTTNYEINRFYLLFSLIFSLCIPFLSINIGRPQVYSDTTPMMNILLEEIRVVANYNAPVRTNSPLFTIILTLYITGVLFLSAKLAYGLYSIKYLLKKNEKAREKEYLIVKLNGLNTSFSFFRYIFIGEANYTTKEDINKIIAHEKVHSGQLHSIDIILVEIATILLWVNPLIWLLRKAIKDNHEYIADNEVIKKYPAGSYLQLLLNQTTKAKISYGNCFAYSNLKKRMIMISRKTSGKYSLMSYIPAIITVMALFISFACSNEVKEEKPKTGEDETSVEIKKNTDDVTTTTKSKSREYGDDEVFVVVENMPQFPGGMKALIKFIGENVKYPAEAKKKEIEGRVFVGFVIDKDGSVINARVLREVDPSLDAEALRVIKSMPKWKPGTKKGKEVKVSYTIPINFALK